MSRLFEEEIPMKAFMDKDFLLTTDTAKKLYHDYAAQMPIYDYHCHLNPKEIVDNIWAYESEWSNEIKADGKVPEMKAKNIITDATTGSPVPNVVGMGLKDAIYAIENSGYTCEYSGIGHVKSQTPKAGSQAAKGGTVKIELK